MPMAATLRSCTRVFELPTSRFDELLDAIALLGR